MLLRIRDIVRRSVRPFGLAVFSSLRSGLGTKRWFSSHGAQCASCRHYFIPTTRWPHDSTPAAACCIYGAHVVASARLSRLLSALPAEPSREAARWGRVAARDQTRRLSSCRSQGRRAGEALQPMRRRRHRLLHTERILQEQKDNPCPTTVISGSPL